LNKALVQVGTTIYEESEKEIDKLTIQYGAIESEEKIDDIFNQKLAVNILRNVLTNWKNDQSLLTNTLKLCYQM